MKILGVDPGLRQTGYGLIESAGRDSIRILEAGLVKTDEGDGIAQRVMRIYRGLEEIVAQYRPDIMILEKIFSHYKHPATAILMGHARGIACLVCGKNNIPLVNYPATMIKKAICGNGQASKLQVQRMVRHFLQLDPQPYPADVSDALAIAMSYVFVEMH